MDLSRVGKGGSRQLQPSGHMIFSVVCKAATKYGQGKPLGEDWFKCLPGLSMCFYDAVSIQREFGP